MSLESDILAMLDPLYEAASEGTTPAWTIVLEHMVSMLSSGPAALTLYSHAADEFSVMASTYSKGAVNAYNKQFRHISTFHPTIIKMRPGDRFWRHRDRPDKEFLSSDVYLNFFKKEGVYDLFYSVLLNRDGVSAGVTFSRPNAASVFDTGDFRIIDRLLPNLRRAINVYLTLTDVRQENLQLRETMSRIPRSTLFVDSSARVMFANNAAKKALGQRDGLEIDRNGRLFANLSKDERQLKSILSGIFEANETNDATHGEVLTISRPSGRRPLQALISPFSGRNYPTYAANDMAMIFIYDPERVVEVFGPALCKMYGLTPAEARLAGLIAQGKTLKEAAALLEIKPETVRTHLKRIFSKTNTRRQGDLITLILNSPAALKHN